MPRTMSNLSHEVEVELISPKNAASYMDGTFERNRPLIKEVVAMYAKRMDEGDFLTATPIVFAQVGNDKIVLVDGQHRMSAISKGTKSLRFTVQTYYLSNDDQLKQLYGTLDVGRARNLNDNIRAHGMPEMMDLTQNDCTSLTSALNFVTHKRPAFNIKARLCGTFTEQIERARKWLTEGQWYFNLLKETPRPMKAIARRKAIVASAMITLRGYPSKAKDFWKGVLTLENINSDDIRFKLHMKLIEMDQKTITNPKALYHSSWHIGSIIACCWNAYISNRQMTIIKGLNTIVFKRCRWKEEKEQKEEGE